MQHATPGCYPRGSLLLGDRPFVTAGPRPAPPRPAPQVARVLTPLLSPALPCLLHSPNPAYCPGKHYCNACVNVSGTRHTVNCTPLTALRGVPCCPIVPYGEAKTHLFCR